jgi:hypothetical protein
MESNRIEAGKLAETWHMLLPLGSAWTDAVAQEQWTSRSDPLRGATSGSGTFQTKRNV